MIVAADAERAVELHAMLLAPRLVGLPHRRRIDRIFGVVVPRVMARNMRGDPMLQLRERRAGQRIDLPRLQIAAGGRARRTGNEVPHDRRIDRLVEKPAAGNAGIDGIEHVHDHSHFADILGHEPHTRPASESE